MKVGDIVKKLLKGEDISDILDNKSDSSNGYIFEVIFKILLIDKKIKSININYSKIYNCQMSEVLKSSSINNIEYIYNENIYSNNGGKSDVIIKSKSGFIFVSIKYKNNFVPGESDIEKINNEAICDLKLNETEYNLSYVCKNKEVVKAHRHKHNNLKKYFDTIIENKLLFDLNDVKNGICEFHKLYKNMSYNDYCIYINKNYLNNNREILIERLHQKMTLNKFIINYNNNELTHLISHKTRTGKSITQLLIIKWLIENSKKVLFITSVPSTLVNFIDDLEKYVIFKNIKYHKVCQSKEKICITKNSLTLCSIQYLKNDIKGNKTIFLKKQLYDAIVIDECHYGSSTIKTKNNIIDIDKITEDIRRSAKISIFSSGTSNKTQRFYKINSKCVYKWSLYDESQMKLLYKTNYINNEIIDSMIFRHGKVFKEVINDASLNRDYTNMPTQMLMKATIPQKLVNQINDYKEKYNKDIGFSLKQLFSLQSIPEKDENGKYKIKYLPKFKLEETVDGESILENYLDNIISDNKMKSIPTVMKRIEIAQSKYNSRKSTKESPKLIIIYLPTHTRNSSIDMLQQALINFIKKKKIWCNYHIVYANSKENMGDYKKEYNEEIVTAINETKLKDKIGCILLLGDKGTTGITYNECDVSIHLDDGHNIESQIQKRARAGTPAKDKTIFINVDMNIQRSLYTLHHTIKQYQVGNKKNLSYKDILIYLYKNNIFLWNDDDFNNGEMTPNKLDSYFQQLSNKVSNEIDYVQIMNELCDEIDCNDYLKNHIDGNIDINKYKNPSTNPELEGEQKNVPKGSDTKIEIDRIKKNEIDNLDANDINGKEEIEKTVEDTINKTSELAKSKRGLPFLALIARIQNPKNIKIILETESTLIKEILKPKISKINIKYIYDIYISIMINIIDKYQAIVNQIVEIYKNTPAHKLRHIIATHFIASAEEELANAEIPTPPILCDEMLNPIPDSFWKNVKKVGELCCGKGNFVLAIFDKFYEGLRDTYPNEYERCKIIATKCIYFADINPLDIFITKSILKCHIQSYCGDCELDYEFNGIVCDTLKTNIKERFNIDGFDAIIGNPPYNSPGKKATGNTIWQLFTNKAIDEWLVDDGYLVYVHPPGWRKPNTSRGKFNGMYKKMAIDNQMIYLEIHNTKDGQKVFNKGTRYDFYLLQKTARTYNTQLKDEHYNKSELDLSLFEWLPNSNISDIMKILTDVTTYTSENCPIIQSMSAYEPRKSHMSKIKTEEFKYPCIHSTPKNGLRYMWSNRNDKGHFGIPKVIFGDTGFDTAIIDLKGEYGMTQHSMAIEINDLQEGENILKALQSEKFNNLKDSCLFSSYAIDWNIFKTFKRDWWKEYIIVDNCPIIYNRSNYGSDKKYVSKNKSEEYKFPLIHATNKNGIRYMYSNCNDKGHFGVSKVIFGQTGINDVIIDLDGKYGMTEHAIAIEVTNLEEANNLKLALLSNKFNETLKSTMYSNFMIDWRIFTSFKRDWWKEYVSIDKCPIIQSMSAYEPRKKHMSKTKSDEFKYPCVHSTPKNGIRYMWSNCNDRGHFGIPKVIFGESGVYNAIIDLNGEYGITHAAMGIQIKDLEEGKNILQALKSEKFNKIIKSMMFGNFRIDWNNFKTFKRDWWKEYVNDETIVKVNVTNNLNQSDDINESMLTKMTVKQLKTYIKEHKLKIKLAQKKDGLIKSIINNK